MEIDSILGRSREDFQKGGRDIVKSSNFLLNSTSIYQTPCNCMLFSQGDRSLIKLFSDLEQLFTILITYLQIEHLTATSLTRRVEREK